MERGRRPTMTDHAEHPTSLPGKAQSYWIATTKGAMRYPPLSGDITCDVAILGGGIVGITAAYLLRDAGRSVVLIEAGRLLQGTTGNTTAKVTSQHALIYADLIERFGEARARQYARANQAAIDQVGRIIKEENISCDYLRKPAYAYAQSEEGLRKVQKEAEAAKRLGLPASFVTDVPLPFETKGAVRFENQAQIHPAKYLAVLAKAAATTGIRIFEETRALELNEEGDKVTVKTDRGTIRARDVLQATRFPIYDKPGKYYTKLRQSRSYVLGVRIGEPFPDGMFISVEEPIRSLRSTSAKDGELVLVVGDGHQTCQGGDTREHYRHLEAFVRGIYTVRSIDYRWSAEDTMPIDRVPFIGRIAPDHPHIYVATGFRKWGMTNGTAAAMILVDLLQGRSNPWTGIFNPARPVPEPPSRGASKKEEEVAKELPHDPGKLAPGQGAIMEIDGKEVAAYRDGNGGIHLLNPACGHMGCTVCWNEAEQSWDCPCHGSRYTPKGAILEGPTVRPLQEMEKKE
jgi:glycine/D-amino acid oxidase-like deaminating enzyme/nitrite reductase/ring-hydroxylating ferredoxin subunit